MQQKRLKITSEMVDQVSSDYWLSYGQFTKIQQALQEDLNEKLSKSIGLEFTEYLDDYDKDEVFKLATIETMVTKKNTFVNLYFVTDNLSAAKADAGYLTPADLKLLRSYKTGQASAKDLYMRLDTTDFDLFVRRAFITIPLKDVVRIYNSDAAHIELDNAHFSIHE